MRSETKLVMLMIRRALCVFFTSGSSCPRKRASISLNLDPRFRGDDGFVPARRGLLRRRPLLAFFALTLGLSGCVSADPQLVARAVEATLKAVATPTPIVVVVTVASVEKASIPTVTAAPPTVAPTSTPTLAPTLTLPSAAAASPSAAPSATLTPGAIGLLAFEDDFQQPGNWDLGKEDGLQRKVIANGWLSVTVKLADRFVVAYRPQSVPNAYIQVSATAPACHTRDRYGVIFRVVDSQNYYLFDVDCDGRFRLAKMEAGTLTPLVDWTANAAIHVGGGSANDLTVRAVGPNLAVSANGISLAKVADSTFTLGGFGFSVGSGLTVPYTAAFSVLRVWEPAP